MVKQARMSRLARVSGYARCYVKCGLNGVDASFVIDSLIMGFSYVEIDQVASVRRRNDVPDVASTSRLPR